MTKFPVIPCFRLNGSLQSLVRPCYNCWPILWSFRYFRWAQLLYRKPWAYEEINSSRLLRVIFESSHRRERHVTGTSAERTNWSFCGVGSPSPYFPVIPMTSKNFPCTGLSCLSPYYGVLFSPLWVPSRFATPARPILHVVVQNMYKITDISSSVDGQSLVAACEGSPIHCNSWRLPRWYMTCVLCVEMIDVIDIQALYWPEWELSGDAAANIRNCTTMVFNFSSFNSSFPSFPALVCCSELETHLIYYSSDIRNTKEVCAIRAYKYLPQN